MVRFCWYIGHIWGIVGGILHMVQFVQLSNNILMSILSTIFISFCSQGGDLAESSLKRYFEVKELFGTSGND